MNEQRRHKLRSIESRLAILEAKDEIRELTAHYCHAVADGDAVTVLSLFCEDGVFRTGDLVSTGRAELRKLFVSIEGRTYKPFIQNHVIELLDENHASGRCSVEIRALLNGEAYTLAGYYIDQYRRTDGRWRFAERHYIEYHNVPWREGWKA